MALANKTGDNIEIGTTNYAEDGTTLFGVAGSNGFGGEYVLRVTHSGGLAAPPMIAIRADCQHVGVYGSSQESTGVYGSSERSVGVYGSSERSIGVYGNGQPAGYFNGDVRVTGTLTAPVKNAVVSFPDGSHRLLHCMESPEHWFEDFGSARLMRGRATVKLDADFAKVVKLSDYRVFLTPEGDCQGLYLKSKRGKSFEVRELQGGANSIAFSYRIVAKRKDIKAHTRFAKMDTRLPMAIGTRRQGRGRKTAQSFPRTLAARRRQKSASE
jgi:hypothetical protein